MRHECSILASSLRIRLASSSGRIIPSTIIRSILQASHSSTLALRGEVAGKMSHHSARDYKNRSSQSAQVDSIPEAEPQEVINRPDRPSGRKGLPKKRDTHFLCFPLVTDTSIPQLAESLRHFRDVTTKPALKDTHAASEDEKELAAGEGMQSSSSLGARSAQGVASDAIEENMNRSEGLPTSNPDLQILPAIVHRPPGTFHLTLGVMDLSTQQEMDRALKLLQELDYANIFEQVLAQQAEIELPQRSTKQDEDSTTATNSQNKGNQVGAEVASLERPISPPLKSGASLTQASNFTKDKPPSISLSGLSTFPAAKTSRVFYAKPSPTRSAPFPLLEFGKAIRRRFREAGFITETRPLVLHATVANMRYAVQPKGGRTSKGKTWRYGKDRWTDGQVDARELIKCFDYHAGNVQEYTRGASSDDEAHEFIWAKHITVNRVAICKMGAEKSDDKVLGMVYPPVGEKAIFS